MENLDKYIDELIKEKGLAEKDEETLKQIKADLFDAIEDRINTMVMEKLPIEALSQFEEKLDTGTEEEIQNFLLQYIPDIKERINFELISFKTMYLS